ncbi:hypothetical protein DRW03_18860 [Corallococcus sp. H22C18031201]|nr:hypothetical protein DRW03_18860 [Corallococcus sp. H22C18031201]
MASLTVCQTGPRCSSAQTYPVLFVVNPEDGALSGTVRLQKGCTSPALPPVSSALPQTSLLVLKAAPRGAAPPPAEAPPAGAPAAAPAAPSGGGAGPASSVAGQRSKTEVQVALALEQGHRALAAQDARSALAQFESALQADDRNLSAMLGRGASQLALGKAAEALSTVERARALNPRHADPYFWLACAQLRLNKRAQALEALKGAVGRGWAAPEGHWLVDAELKRLSDAGAEFQPLLKQARSRKRPASREPQGFGSASP